ncbi:MAG: hypothetical protein QXX79_07665 [Candidatus Bathyarchaeia archaeon]
MTKPSRGKTETIKDGGRKVSVSISKFVIERVKDFIRREEGERAA